MCKIGIHFGKFSNHPGRAVKRDLSALERKKRTVWTKGFIVPGHDPDEYRVDDNRRLIRYADFRKKSSQYGWDFDVAPVQRSRSAPEDSANLRPLNLRDVAAGARIQQHAAARPSPRWSPLARRKKLFARPLADVVP